jgi:hypothetical protein
MPNPVVAGATAKVELTVQNPQPGTVYNWGASDGAFEPKTTQLPYSGFSAPAQPGDVRITIVLTQNDRVVAVHEELVPITLASHAVSNTNPPPETAASPSIEITQIPVYDPLGGPGSETVIGGVVKGSNSGHYRVVIYSKTDDWWVQPTEAQPLTLIDADGTWIEHIHTGSEYAALLVRASYEPPSRPPILPRKDGTNILAITRVRGRTP